MTLMRCRACSAVVDSAAEACLKCGAPVAKARSHLPLLAVALLTAVAGAVVWNRSTKPEPPTVAAATTAPAPASSPAPVAAVSEAEENRQRLARAEADRKRSEANAAREAQDAAIGVGVLKKLLNDPYSLRFETIMVMRTGAACYVYRAKNAFGAYRKFAAVLTPPDGRKFLTSEDDAFEPLWAGYCRNMDGRDVTKEAAGDLAG